MPRAFAQLFAAAAVGGLLASCAAPQPARNWSEAEANCVRKQELTPSMCKCLFGHMSTRVSFERFSSQMAELARRPPEDDWVSVKGDDPLMEAAELASRSPHEPIRHYGNAMKACLPPR